MDFPSEKPTMRIYVKSSLRQGNNLLTNHYYPFKTRFTRLIVAINENYASIYRHYSSFIIT